MRTSLWIRGGLLLSALIFAGIAFAQSEPTPRRGEIGVPPASDGGGAGWTFVNITGQAGGSTLQALAVDAAGGVYVWSLRREYWPVVAGGDFDDTADPRRTEPGTPPYPGDNGGGQPLLPGGEGGFAPTPSREGTGEAGGPDGGGGGDIAPVPGTMRSTLFYGGDAGWTVSLEVSDEAGASVFVAGSGEVFVATDLPDGSVRVRRLQAGQWRTESLPQGVTGPAGAFAGGDHIYFRTGASVLRLIDNQWDVALTCSEMAGSGGLVYLNTPEPELLCEAYQVMAFCEGHDHLFDGELWTVNDETLPTHVHGAWAGRDLQGELHLFAAGTCSEHSFLRIFHFTETQPGTLLGVFHIDREDPLPDHPWPGSYANRVWGSQVHDVYMTGVASGYGHLYHFDGERWWIADPTPNLPATLDVCGTASGDLWVSLADGRLLHRHGTAQTMMPADPPVPGIAPELAVAVPASASLVVRSGLDGTAAMEFSLPEDQQVTLAMFDLAGRRVETLRQDRLRAGVHQVTWNAARVPSGIYFCRLEAGPLQIMRRVLIHR